MDSSARELLRRAASVLTANGHGLPPGGDGAGVPALLREPLRVGVDLGTANTVLLALDRRGQPVAGAMHPAQVVRDGLVVDFIGAVDLLRELKARVEETLGVKLTAAATLCRPTGQAGFPPGVPVAERRATANVLEAAGLNCVGLVDEPTAANRVLGVRDGAVVDVGGGTTGIAILQNGEVVYTADEATGGTHFTLVLAGARNVTFEEAEALKTTVCEQPRLLPVVRPVMEKAGSIIRRHVAGRAVERLYLVGGASSFYGFPQVIEEYTGLPATLAEHPLFVTPLGIAMSA